jgi:hypothetical protein
MVIFVENIFFSHVIFGKLQITFTKSPITASGVVFAKFVSVSLSVFVPDEFSDTRVSVGGAGAFLAIFVLFTYSIKSINWGTVAGVAHWSIA